MDSVTNYWQLETPLGFGTQPQRSSYFRAHSNHLFCNAPCAEDGFVNADMETCLVLEQGRGLITAALRVFVLIVATLTLEVHTFFVSYVLLLELGL